MSLSMQIISGFIFILVTSNTTITDVSYGKRNDRNRAGLSLWYISINNVGDCRVACGQQHGVNGQTYMTVFWALLVKYVMWWIREVFRVVGCDSDSTCHILIWEVFRVVGCDSNSTWHILIWEVFRVVGCDSNSTWHILIWEVFRVVGYDTNSTWHILIWEVFKVVGYDTNSTWHILIWEVFRVVGYDTNSTWHILCLVRQRINLWTVYFLNQ